MMPKNLPTSGAGFWITSILAAILYFLTAKLGMLLATVEGNVTPIWPPAGIALAALLLGGPRYLPAVALGTFASVVSTNAPWQFILTATVGDTAAALAGLWLLDWRGLDRSLPRVRDIIDLVLWGGLVACLVSAAFGVAGLLWAGMAPWPGLGASWSIWWLGDSMGVIVLTPFLLYWFTRAVIPWTRQKAWELLAWVAAAVLAAWAIFGGWAPVHVTHVLVFITFPLLLWAALRFGRRVTATCAMFTCYATAAATAVGLGPFAGQELGGNLVLLWIYMGTLVATSLALATATGQARQANEELSRHSDELAQAVERRTAQLVASHQQIWQSHQRMQAVLDGISDGFFTLDHDTVFTYFNAAAERLIKRPAREVLGLPFAQAFPEAAGSFLEQQYRKALAQKKPLAFETFFEPEPYRNWFDVRIYPSENGISVFFRVTTEQKTAALELARSEERLRTLVEESPVGVAVISPEGEYLYVNPQLRGIFGYEPAEITQGEEWFRKAYPDPAYRREVISTWKADLAASRVGQVRPRTYQVTCKSGETKTVEFRPVTLSTGEQLVIYEDVSERENILRSLRLNEEKFFKAFQSSPLWVVLSSLEDGRLLEVNEAFLESTGFTRQEVIGRTSSELGIAPSEESRREVVEKLKSRGSVRALKVDMLTKSGSRLHGLYYGTLIEVGGEDLVLSLLQDVTERTLTEEALAESEEKYRTLFQTAQDGIFLLRDEEFWDCNDRIVEMFGCPRERIIGASPWDFSPPYQPDGRPSREAGRGLKEPVLDGKAQFFEWQHQTAAGEPFDTEVSLNRLVIAGQVHVLGVLRDITERKRAEQALRASEEKFQKLYMTSPAWIALTTLNQGRFVEVNDAFCQVTGYTRSEVIGKTSTQIGLWPPGTGREPIVRQLRRDGCLRSHPVEFIVKDGQPRHLLWSAEIMEQDPEPLIISVLLDVTELRQAQQAMVQSEEKYRTLFQTAQDGIFLLHDDQFWDCNDRIVEMFGCPREQIIGAAPWDFWPPYQPDGRPSRQASLELKNLVLDGDARFFEWRHQTAAGEPFDTEVSLNRLVIAGQVNVLGVLRDITERKRAEQALRASEEKFQKLYMASPVWMNLSTIKDGRIIEVNEAYHRVTGYSREETVNHTSKQVGMWVDFRDREVIRQELEREGSLRDYPVAFRMKDGQIRHFLMSAERVEFDPEPYLISALLDVTDLIRAQEALAQSEEQYRLLVDNAQDAIYILQDGCFVFANPEVQRVTGYSAEELESLEFTKLIHPDQAAMVARRYADRLAGKPAPNNYPLCLVARDGSERWIQTKGILISWRGRPALLYTSRDITQQRVMEAQLRQSQKMEAVGTLAGGIAHDFNNILAAMMGFAELSLDGVEPHGELAGNLDEILKAGERGRGLVQQILAFSRGTERVLEPLDLGELIQEAQKMLRAAIPSNITIKTHLEPCGPVRGDPIQLHQVLINLVTNAAQAMEDTGGVIGLGLQRTELSAREAARMAGLMPGSYVQLTVSDTGPGIPRQLRDRVFEPFFTTKEAGKGSGLGLAAVHGIVQSHLGAVGIREGDGRGSVFQVLLPEAQEATPAPGRAAASPVPTGREHILFVDDEASLVEVGSHVLKRLGYRVSPFTDSRLALAAFQADPEGFDLIITDQTMPGLTGAALTQGVKALRPEVPVIIATGFSHQLSAESAAQLGVSAFVMKPITSREIAKVVRRALDEPQGPGRGTS